MNLNPEKLKEILPFEFDFFEVIDSTSLYLARCIKEGKAPPRLVIASEQTNGQGRIGKSFYSPANTGLYLTFCFSESEILAQDLTPRLALGVSKAIFRVFGISCQIKWVNDLYRSGRKICGVLCQKIGEYLLFGIGINMALPSVIPSEIEHRFGALFDQCDSDLYPPLILALYEELIGVLSLPKSLVLNEYRQRIFHIGRRITISHNNQSVSGICTGIADDFSILVKTEGGELAFSSGYMIVD